MTEKKTIKNFVETLERRVNDIREDFNELKTEMTRRFGPRNDDEIFRPLPKAQALDVPLQTVLMNRRSERSFSDEPITDYDLSTLLNAVDGINRPNGKRTTPSCLNWREIEVYVLKSNGIWRWVPERNGLLFLSIRDVREETGFGQPAILAAPVELVYVANFQKTRGRMTMLGEKIIELFNDDWDDEAAEDIRRRAADLNAGAKVQMAYLAAAALHLSTVVRLGFDPERLGRALHLGPDEKVIAVQSLGYRPSSILDHIR